MPVVPFPAAPNAVRLQRRVWRVLEADPASPWEPRDAPPDAGPAGLLAKIPGVAAGYRLMTRVIPLGRCRGPGPSEGYTWPPRAVAPTSANP